MSDEVKGLAAGFMPPPALQEARGEARLKELGARLGTGGPGAARDLKETEKAATDFEAMLVQQMLKSMWSTVPSQGMLSSSREEEYYRDMLNEGLARDIAEKRSIGIKDVILRELMERQKK